MMLVLDTDHMSVLEWGGEGSAALRERLADLAPREVATTIINYDEQAAEFHCLRRGRIRVGSMDLRIAAVVLSRGATLLSRNLADFRKVPGLNVEDWTR